MMYPNHLYSDDLEIHTIEIPKWEKNKDRFKNLDPLTSWIAYFSKFTSDEQRKEIAMQNAEIKQVLDTEKLFMANPNLITVYDQKEKAYKDNLAREQFLIEQTTNKNICGMITSLKEDNLSYDHVSLLIQRAFKLSNEEVSSSMKKYWNE